MITGLGGVKAGMTRAPPVPAPAPAPVPAPAPAPIFTVFALIVTGPENVSEPPKLSVLLRAVRDCGSRALAQRNGLRRPPAELARRARVHAQTDEARTLLFPVPMCVPKAFFRGNRWGAQCA